MPPEAGVLHQIDGELAFELSVDGDLLIGRDATSDLVLDDSGVSRAHSCVRVAGRNFDEILRVDDSLQLTTYQKVATPADWQQGEDVVILPTVTDEEARELFPDGFTTHRPYLRTTAQPRNLIWPRPTKVGSRAGAHEEDATAVEGSWALTMKTPMDEREVTLDATEDGGSFSGMHSGQQGSSEISDGTIDGDAVPWQVTIDAPMGEMVLSFSGSLDGDSISGDVQFGSFGSGTFAGKRA